MMFNLLVVRRSFRRPFRITLTVNEHDNAWVGRIDGDCEQGQQLGLDESLAIYQTQNLKERERDSGSLSKLYSDYRTDSKSGLAIRLPQ